jgi:ATP-binding cassette subfamily F protein uup
MPLLSFDRISISFGADPLLDAASFQLDAGERVCLIGRNGTGKSTLLGLAADRLAPDSGEIWRQPRLRIAELAQELHAPAEASVFELVAGGVPGIGTALAEYHAITARVGEDASLLGRMEQLQHEIEAADGWALDERVAQTLDRHGLDGEASFGVLSGGWRRRVALARALVSDPELLLLDEPTNHLDIEVIERLEDTLLEFRGGVLFVTHDRALLTRLATRILELDRGHLTSWPGDYPRFLEAKAAALEDEERHEALFDKKLAQEEAWIRRGIKARRTRNEGRVRALFAMREERKQRRERIGRASFEIDEAQLSGKLVVDAVEVSFSWNGSPLVRDFSARIQRGDRVALIGPNGSGKTTLLQLLLGRLTPQRGSIRLGTKLEIAYFDQLRAQLDPEATVADTIGEGREHLEIAGQRRHVIGYLQDFLFSPDRIRSRVRTLSGGERNRLLLARLFAQPANLLVLDEPTNDLDVETLELLEERLLEWNGTLLLVSHDRRFVDNVATQTFAFEGEGRVFEYVGGYSDWQRQKRKPVAAEKSEAAPAAPDPPSTPAKVARKLGFSEQRELAELPARIEALETQERALSDEISQPAFYARPRAEQESVRSRLAAIPEELSAAYARWEELEARRT